MKQRREFVHQVVDELRDLKEQGPFEPTADIDIVWVLSAPGTIKANSNDGIYNGESADRKTIELGIEIVRQVTALRLGKELALVTKEDIAAAGPTFYYNGEDSATESTKYPQNKHLEEAVSRPEFPLPASNVVIGHIEFASTPYQVEDFAGYLQAHPAKKVAVVSLIQHSVRVGRYIERYKELFPEGVTLLNAPTPETTRTVGKTLREVRKVIEYAAKGDLAEESYFSDQSKK